MSDSTIPPSDRLSLVRASEISGCPYQTLYLHFKSGKLDGQYIEGRIFTTMNALRSYLTDRALEGRLGGGR